MPTPEPELKRLMLAGLDGDERAYRALLQRLSGHLRGYYKGRLARAGRGAAEAEDLVQETLMAIHNRRHTYDPSQLFTPWVHAVARYKLIDHLRATRTVLAELPADDATDLLAQDDHAAAESAYDLGRLLNTLPAKMRRAIQAVKLDGLSVAEAAQTYGTSEAAVKVHVHRGMRALADTIRTEKRRHEN